MAEHTNTVATAADIRRRKFYRLRVGDVVFRCRHVDLVSLFLEGIVPTPLLRAVDEVQNVRRRLQQGGADELGSLSHEDLERLNDAVRRLAVLVVDEPKLTHSKKASLANPDLLWVGGYSDVEGDDPSRSQMGDVTLHDLMHVWRAGVGERDGLVIMPDADAREFRPAESPTVADAVSDGDRVRAETVVVDPSPGAGVTAGADSPLVREWISYQ